MVVQRTLNKIEELKERPHHERRAVAMYWAVGVVGFLVLFWGFFTLRTLGRTAMRLNAPRASAVAVETAPQGNPSAASAASAAAALEASSGAQPQGYTASSTNGTVDIIKIR